MILFCRLTDIIPITIDIEIIVFFFKSVMSHLDLA
jgi:hypothetical protein